MSDSMKTIRVVAAVIHADGKIFATQRGYGEYKDGWEFPGGKIEAGEAPEDAIKREIREELGTEISVGELIDTIEYDYPNFHLSMDCFWCEIESGDLVLKEHEAAKWLDKESLYGVDWLPADISIVEKIKEKIDSDSCKTKKGYHSMLWTIVATVAAYAVGAFLDYSLFVMHQQKMAAERGIRVGHAVPFLTLLLPIVVFAICIIFWTIKKHNYKRRL